jgi:hypothetical protein
MQEPPPANDLLAELARFAEQLASRVSDGAVRWKGGLSEGAWSLTEVVCHLRDVEREVHQRRLKALIEEPGAFLSGAVADEWAEERGYKEQNGPEALAAFLAAREETLQLLHELDESMWARRGQHAFFGSTSLHELVHLMVQHDAAHWEQIIALLATPYDSP